MAANTSQLISNIVNSPCPLSIWDPCPQSQTWRGPPPVCGGEASLVSQLRRQLATAPLANNPFFPKFIPPSDDSVNCNNWQPLNNDVWKNKETRIISRITVPQYSTDNTLFRFCIILGGPPGSGKSTMIKSLRSRAQIINMKASRKPWVALGHDQIICQDPTFQKALNLAPRPPPATPKHIKQILKELHTPNSLWNSEMKRQNMAYHTSRGIIDDKSLLRDNIIKYVPILNKDNSEEIISYLFRSNDIELKNIIELWCREKFIEQGQNPPFGDPATGNINNTELLYIKTALCIINGRNITYETTLKDTKSIQYLFRLSQELTLGCTQYNYIFLMGFPIVSFNCLEDRLVKRYLKWASQPLAERAKSLSKCMTVGLPDVSRREFVTKMQNAYLTLASLIWFCTGNKTAVEGSSPDPGREQCPAGLGIDFLLIFDNTGCIKEKEYIMVPISRRSYNIGLNEAFKRQPSIQTNTKRAIIAILMRSLNCIKGISLCAQSCTGQDCPKKEEASSLKDEEEIRESKSDVAECWSLPPSQDIDLDPSDIEDGSQGSSLYSMEEDITDFMDERSLISWAAEREEIINLRRKLKMEYPHDQATVDAVLNNPFALFALRLLFQNLPEIQKAGVPFYKPRGLMMMNPLDKLLTVYTVTQIYSYLQCIIEAGGVSAETKGVGSSAAASCSYTNLSYKEPISGENKHFPVNAIDCLEKTNCGTQGGAKKTTRKKRHKKGIRRTRRKY